MACGYIVTYVLKILRYNIHLLFPYGNIMLSMLLTYNIRLRQNNKWMMVNQPRIKQK